jgi:hypothetical protein
VPLCCVIKLNVAFFIVMLCHFAECRRYTECHYDQCHYAECHYTVCCYDERHYAECHYANKLRKSPAFPTNIRLG